MATDFPVSPISLCNVLLCSICMALRSNRMNILYVHRNQNAFIPDYYIFHKSSLNFIGINNSHHLLSSSMLRFRSLEQEKHKANAIFLRDFMHSSTEKAAAPLLLLVTSSMGLRLITGIYPALKWVSQPVLGSVLLIPTSDSLQHFGYIYNRGHNNNISFTD